MNEQEKALFDIPDGLIYLNTANIGPRLKAVSDAGNAAIARFAHPWTISDEDWFKQPETLRAAFAALARTKIDSVALIPSASYGIAVAAKNIPVPQGANFVVVDEQYPSNIYSWRRKAVETSAEIRTAPRSADLSLTDSVLQAIDSRTAIVAIPNCHWTDGELIDLLAVSAAAKAVGAALVVDASQSFGALPIDLDVVDPDFVVAVGYKWLLGPYGLGYMVVSDRRIANGIPIEESWLNRRGSDDFAQLVSYVDEYRAGARRFDFGESPQFISVPMAIAAVSQLNAWGTEYIYDQLSQRTALIRDACDRLGISVLPRNRTAGHLIGIPMPDSQKAGLIAAEMRANNIIVSQRGNIIRVAPHLHTTQSDLAKFCELLKIKFKELTW